MFSNTFILIINQMPADIAPVAKALVMMGTVVICTFVANAFLAVLSLTEDQVRDLDYWLYELKSSDP